eukprot:484136_1
MEAKEEEMKRVRGIVNDMNQLCTETISKFRDENENKIQITTTKIAQMKYNVKAIMREIVRQTEQIKSLDIVNEEAKWRDATNALQTSFSQKDNEVKRLMSTQNVDSIYQNINSKNDLTSTQNVDSIYQDINSKNLKRMRKENEEYKERMKEMDKEAKEMEQSIDDLTTIKTKSLQQIESLKHQINVKQSESQKQSDLMKQLEEKHTAATRVKEEEIVSMRNAHANEKAKLNDEKMVELAQKDRVIQDMKHEQQTKEEKRNKAMEAKEEEMKRVRGIVNDMNQLCTETISKFRNENESKIQITTTKIAQMKHNVNTVMGEIVRQTEQIKSLDIVNEEAKWRDATNALQTSFSQKDNEVKHLTSTQNVDSIYQDINSKNLKRMRKENEEYKERIKEMDEEAKEMEQSIDDLTTIKTKSLQQIESLKHQINVKQSESQKQSDFMKQLEEKHTAATRVKEEEIVSMRNAHANEKAKLNDEKMVELAQKDRVIQDMKHEQQTKEEKHNKAMDRSERGRDNVIKY